MRIKSLLSLFTILFISFLSACSAPKKDGGTGDTPPATGGTEAVPAPAPGTGQLLISISDKNADPATVSGYVVGKQELVVGKAGDQYYVNNIPPGSPDVIVTAGSLAVGLTGKSKLGVRENDIKIAAGAAATLTLATVPVVGSVKGIVTLKDRTDHAGIDVYIPGTSYMAKTASDGSYEIAEVPAGNHDVYFEKDGYGRGVVTNLKVESTTATTATTLELIIKTGPEAKMQLADGSPVVNTLTVKVVLIPSDDAVLYMMSEDVNFKNVGWSPLITKTSFTFAAGGAKVIYARFADANGLETSPISAAINVDVSGPTGNVQLNSGATHTNSRTVNVLAQMTDDFSTVAQMQSSLSESFAGATWVTYAATSSIQLADSQGTQNVYTRYRDQFENVSATITTSITYDSIAPTVSSVSPSNSGTSVGKTSNVTVTFSEAILPATVTTSSFRLLLTSNSVPGALTVNGSAMTLNPDQDLEPFSVYSVEATTGVTDMAGNPLSSAFSSSFTTDHYWSQVSLLRMGAPDVGSLAITSTTAGKILAVWWSESKIFGAISTDGQTFGAPVTISTNGGATQPILKLDFCSNGKAALVWDNMNVAYFSGTSWGAGTNISPGAATLKSMSCSKNTGDANAIAVIMYEFGSKPYACMASSAAPSCSGTMLENANMKTGAVIAADSNGRALAIWDADWDDGDNTYDGERVFYSYYNGSWSVAAKIEHPQNQTKARAMDIKFDASNNATVIWRRGPGIGASCNGALIMAERFTSAGTPTGTAVAVDKDNSDCTGNARIAVTSTGDVHAVWESGVATATVSANRYTASAWGGANTSPRPMVNDVQSTPQIAAGGSLILSAWIEDFTDGEHWFNTFSSGTWQTAATAFSGIYPTLGMPMTIDSNGTAFVIFAKETGANRGTYWARYR